MEGSYGDADEDDVLLKGSPLYEYLKETCPAEEFNSFTTPTEVNGTSTSETNHQNYLSREKILQALHSFQLCLSKTFNQLSVPVDSKDFVTYLNHLALPGYLSLAVDSKCITSDDTSMLTSLIDVSSTPPRLSRRKIILWMVLFVLLMCGHILLIFTICQSSVLVDKSSTDGSFHTPVLYASLLVLLLLLVLWQIVVLFKYFALWRLHIQNEISFKTFLTLYTSFGDCLKTSIMYVQEVEVILRGYTMMTPFTPISHLERGSQTQLQCPALRKSILRTARNQFLSLRQATLATLAFFPLPEEAECDLDDLYLATSDLSRLTSEMPFLSDESQGPLPTSHLKALANLYSDQLSEFIRRHLMSLCNHEQSQQAAASEWHVTLDGARSSADTDLHNLQVSFRLHQPRAPSYGEGELASKEEEEEDKRQRSQKLWGPREVLASSSRALRLHLDVATKSSERLLTSTPDALSQLSPAEVKGLEQILSEVRGHLEACQTCLHEAGTAITKLSGHDGSKGSKEQDPDNTGNDETQALEPLPDPIDLMAIKEPEIDFIEEEVFEAYIDSERDDTLPDYDMDDLIEEKRKRKQESEDAKHLLVELHSVLSRRQEEKEKMREERRRQRGGGGGGEMRCSEGAQVDAHRCGDGDSEPGMTALGDDEDGDDENEAGDEDVDTSYRDGHHLERGVKDDVVTMGTLEDAESGMCECESEVVDDLNSSPDSARMNISQKNEAEVDCNERVQYDHSEKGQPKTEHLANQYHANIEIGVSGDAIDDSHSESIASQDASGLGENSDTVIQKPVAKPRKSLLTRHSIPVAARRDANRSKSNLNQANSERGTAAAEEKLGLDQSRDSVGSPNGHGVDSRTDADDCETCEETTNDARWSRQHMAMPFMQGLAAQAAKISRERQSLAEDTFGD